MHHFKPVMQNAPPKSVVGRALPGPAGSDTVRSLQRSPRPLAGFKGRPTSKEGEERGGKGREMEGREGEALGPAPTHNFWLRH